MVRRRVRLLLLAAVGSGLACQFISPPKGPFRCNTRDDCQPDEECVGEVCRLAVTDGGACPTLDCANAGCANASCGTGCVCADLARKETACGDTQDNDGDGKADCEDPDCTSAPEICDDGADNNCNRAIDCADLNCGTAPACANLADGAPCSEDGQCKGAKCRTERSFGYPNGSCVTERCDVASDAGCNGGTCFGSAAYSVCYPVCTGNGLGTNGRCRPGYACYGATNGKYFCLPLCDTDAQCAGAGAGYGCNLWSRLCELKDKGKKKYGATCAGNTECETGLCDTGRPAGYCIGTCSGVARTCGAGGICNYDPAGDGQGTCRQACSGPGDCTRGAPYSCMLDAQQQVCWCKRAGSACVSGTECCSGTCGVGNTCT